MTRFYTAENSPIPEFDPGITERPPLPTYAPEVPDILEVISDDSVLYVDVDGFSQARMRIND